MKLTSTFPCLVLLALSAVDAAPGLNVPAVIDQASQGLAFGAVAASTSFLASTLLGMMKSNMDSKKLEKDTYDAKLKLILQEERLAKENATAFGNRTAKVNGTLGNGAASARSSATAPVPAPKKEKEKEAWLKQKWDKMKTKAMLMFGSGKSQSKKEEESIMTPPKPTDTTTTTTATTDKNVMTVSTDQTLTTTPPSVTTKPKAPLTTPPAADPLASLPVTPATAPNRLVRPAGSSPE